MGSASSTTRVALEIQNRVDIDVPESLYAHVPYGPRIRVYALGARFQRDVSAVERRNYTTVS